VTANRLLNLTNDEKYGQDVHNATSAGEHHLLIINLISAIAAEKPRAP
jgi:hypothetical protein